MKRFLFALLASAAIAAPARADTIIDTYTGTIRDYVPSAGYSCDYCNSFVGMPFIATVTFSGAVPVDPTNSAPTFRIWGYDGQMQYAIGPNAMGPWSGGLMTATFSILSPTNPFTGTFAPNTHNGYFTSGASTELSTSLVMFYQEDDKSGGLFLFVGGPGTTDAFNSPLPTTYDPWATGDFSTTGAFSFLDGNGYAVANFPLNVYGINLASAVPEPSTWAMMLIGFAGLGFAAYRRSRKSVGAFAALV